MELKEGLRIPWTKVPPAKQLYQPELTEEEMKYIDQEVQAGLAMEAIEESNEVKIFSPVFTVPKKDSEERRVILNLKFVNQWVEHQHFQMSGLKDVKLLLEPGMWMSKIDLKHAYWQIPLHPTDRQYLGFKWRGKQYRFKVVPFGLACAPLWITKICRPMMAWIHADGIQGVIYIDDLILIGKSKERCTRETKVVEKKLTQLGWLINYKKSITEPTQRLVYLGTEIDTVTMSLQIPVQKMNKIRGNLKMWMKKDTATARECAGILGKLSATADALYHNRVHQSGLRDFKEKALKNGWDTPMMVSQKAREDIQWWIEHLKILNGKSLLAIQPQVIVTTDASNSGWGAVLDSSVVAGQWNREELQLHINHKEAKAVLLAVQSLREKLKGKRVLIKSDSTTVVWLVNRMASPKDTLAEIANSLFEECMAHQISLVAEHIPGSENRAADQASRHQHYPSEWQLNPKLFRVAEHRWGPHTIDLFSSRSNSQLPRYVSRVMQPGAVAADALKQTWANENAWVNPPFCLMMRILRKVVNERVTVTLVAPVWPAQPWFNLMCSMMVDFPIVLPQRLGMFLQGGQPVNSPNWITVIARISGVHSERAGWSQRWQKSCYLKYWEHAKIRCLLDGSYGASSAKVRNAIRFLVQTQVCSWNGSPLWRRKVTPNQR